MYGGYGILFDDVVRGALQVHQYSDFVGGIFREVNAAHGAAVHSADADFRAFVQADDSGELRLQLIRIAEKILAVADYEDADRQDCQRGDDEGS